MSVKTTGIEFKNFYNDENFWPGNTYIEDLYVSINDVPFVADSDIIEAIKDSDIISIKEGCIVDHPDFDGSVMSYFKKWRTTQSKRFITIEVERDQLEHSIKHLKNLQYKVI